MAFTIVCLAIVVSFSSCDSEVPPELAEENPDSVAVAGGDLTVSLITSHILMTYPPSLFAIDLQHHQEGLDVFNQTYVQPSAPVAYGLGPVFAESSCFLCHVNGGRGRPIDGRPDRAKMLLYISRTGTGPFEGPDTVPGYGVVLQPRSIPSVQPEGDIVLKYDPISGSYGDGETYQLRKPTYNVLRVYTGGNQLPAGTLTSARIASQLVGMGLLENIPDDSLLAHEDPGDADGDGISGRVNWVRNMLTNSKTIGRFGWKAGIASVHERAAFDFNQAMGVTSSFGLYSREACYGQPQASGALLDDPEVQSNETLRPVGIFLKTTAVPGRRGLNKEQIRRGQKLFTDGKCAVCHVPQSRTGNLDEISVLRDQTIYPYTDLLLHDMGEGLADNKPEFQASGSEWRTPPLWGIGIVDIVNGNNFYLHDGRAQTLEEAILWHGGEAQQSKQFFVTLPKSDRDALIAFLRSL